jgi:hypothetical protein
MEYLKIVRPDEHMLIDGHTDGYVLAREPSQSFSRIHQMHRKAHARVCGPTTFGKSGKVGPLFTRRGKLMLGTSCQRFDQATLALAAPLLNRHILPSH